MKAILTLTTCILLSACTTLQGDTVKQRYYGLKTDYSTILTGAVAYKRDCYEKAIDHACRDHVIKLRIAAKAAHTALEIADGYLVRDDIDALEASADGVAILVREFSVYLLGLD